MSRSKYYYAAVTPKRVIIHDANEPGSKSVTNDAENVVREVVEEHGDGRRLFYRDSTGAYDELLIENGNFGGFRACTPALRAELLEEVRIENS